MSQTTSNHSTHWLIGGALALTSVFLVVAIVIVNSNADDVTTSTTVSNATPTVTSVYISSSANGGADSYGSGITLTAGSTATVHVNGVFTDTNGGGDIPDNGATVKFFRTAATGGAACSADNNDCYSVSGVSCTLGVASGNTRAYDCPVALQYWADATDAGTYIADNWTASVTVTDTAGPATSSASTKTVEVNSLTALSIPSTIAYGSLALGASTTNVNNVEKTISQSGNTQADVNVSSSAAMTCTTGTIGVGNQEWAVTDVSFGGGGTQLTGTPAQVTGLNVAVRTSEVTDTSSILYWNIVMPPNGAGGSCTGTTTITALAG